MNEPQSNYKKKIPRIDHRRGFFICFVIENFQVKFHHALGENFTFQILPVGSAVQLYSHKASGFNHSERALNRNIIIILDNTVFYL